MKLQELYSIHREDLTLSAQFKAIWSSDIPVKFKYDRDRDFFFMVSHLQEKALVRLQEKFEITTASCTFQESFFSVIIEVFDSFFLLKKGGNYRDFTNNSVKQNQQSICIDDAACYDFFGYHKTNGAFHIVNRNIAVNETDAFIRYDGSVRHRNTSLFQYSYFFTQDHFYISIMKDRFDEKGYSNRKCFKLDDLSSAFDYIKNTFKNYLYDNLFRSYQSVFPVMKEQDNFCLSLYSMLAYYSFSFEKISCLLSFMLKEYPSEYACFQTNLETSPKDALKLFRTFGDLLEMTSYT